MLEAGGALVWTLMILCFACCGLYLHRRISIWRRAQLGLLPGEVKVRGVIRGPGKVGDRVYGLDATPLELRAAVLELDVGGGETMRVLPAGAMLDVRARRRQANLVWELCVGDRVTVDGVVQVVPDRESHYRHASCTPEVIATRISEGLWPELRWLAYPLVFVLGIGGGALLGMLASVPALQPADSTSAIADSIKPNQGYQVAGSHLERVQRVHGCRNIPSDFPRP